MKYKETIKTIALTVVVSLVLGFIAGVHYANVANTKTINLVKTTVQSVSK